MSLKLFLLAVTQLRHSGSQLQVCCVLHGAVRLLAKQQSSRNFHSWWCEFDASLLLIYPAGSWGSFSSMRPTVFAYKCTPVCIWRRETEPEHPPSHNQVWAPKLCWQLKNLCDKGSLTNTINNLCVCTCCWLALSVFVGKCWGCSAGGNFHQSMDGFLREVISRGFPHKDQLNSTEQSFSILSNP